MMLQDDMAPDQGQGTSMVSFSSPVEPEAEDAELGRFLIMISREGRGFWENASRNVLWAMLYA